MTIKSSVRNAKTTTRVSPETADFIKRVHKLTKELSASKEKSQEFLVRTGIYTKNGNLSKAYR